MGFPLLIAFMFYMMVVGIPISFIARRFSKKSSRVWVRIILGAFFIILPFSEVIASNIAYKILCEREVGLHFVQAPEPNTGFFSDTADDCIIDCVKLLLSGAVPFVETDVDRLLDYTLVPDYGLYRFYLSSPSDENCEPFLARMRDQSYKYKDLFLKEKRCLAFKKVDERKSRLTIAHEMNRGRVGIFSFEFPDTLLVQDGWKLISYDRGLRRYKGITTSVLFGFQSKVCPRQGTLVSWFQQISSAEKAGKN